MPEKSPPLKLPTFDVAAAVEPRDALDVELVEDDELLPNRFTLAPLNPALDDDDEPEVELPVELAVLVLLVDEEVEEDELLPPPPPPPPPCTVICTAAPPPILPPDDIMTDTPRPPRSWGAVIDMNLPAAVTPVKRIVFSRLPCWTDAVRTPVTTGPPPPMSGTRQRSRRVYPPRPSPNRTRNK